MAMVRLGKVARGKSRWVGFSIAPAIESREACHASISDYLSGISWKMYDCKLNNSRTLVIIRVPLEECDEAISKIKKCVAASFKPSLYRIKLVREQRYSIFMKTVYNHN